MTKHRSPDERADQILTAARKCFLEQGYFATKMDAIAKESGLSKGGIYFHFSSKREIFRALVEEEYQVAMAIIHRVTDSETDVTEMLTELGAHFVELFAQSDRSRFMVIIGEMALRDAEIAHLLKELQLSYFETVSQILIKGIDQGDIRGVDVDATAMILKSLMDGVQANFAIGIDLDLEKVLAAALDLLSHGLIQQRAK